MGKIKDYINLYLTFFFSLLVFVLAGFFEMLFKLVRRFRHG